MRVNWIRKHINWVRGEPLRVCLPTKVWTVQKEFLFSIIRVIVIQQLFLLLFRVAVFRRAALDLRPIKFYRFLNPLSRERVRTSRKSSQSVVKAVKLWKCHMLHVQSIKKIACCRFAGEGRMASRKDNYWTYFRRADDGKLFSLLPFDDNLMCELWYHHLEWDEQAFLLLTFSYLLASVKNWWANFHSQFSHSDNFPYKLRWKAVNPFSRWCWVMPSRWKTERLWTILVSERNWKIKYLRGFSSIQFVTKQLVEF